jgi:hypothetical protein
MTIVFELHHCSRLAMQCTYRYLNDPIVLSKLGLVKSSRNLLYDYGLHLVISYNTTVHYVVLQDEKILGSK